ncbi:MAG: trehalose-6-phosphate synthase, partial [Nanobdellota archaeon]
SGPYGSKTIHHPMGETLLTAYTIGVPFDKIAKSAGNNSLDIPVEDSTLEELITKDKAQEKMVLVGLERFDYTKGIPYKLQVVEELAKDTPIRLYQATQPSRKTIDAYQQLETACQNKIDNINESYHEDKPIIRLPQGVMPPKNFDFQREGDAILVTTEEDGCNVVVEETIAAQATLPYEKRGFLALGKSGIARVLQDAGFGEEDGVAYMTMNNPSQDASKVKEMYNSKKHISDRLVNFVSKNLNTEIWSQNCLFTMEHGQAEPYIGDQKNTIYRP